MQTSTMARFVRVVGFGALAAAVACAAACSSNPSAGGGTGGVIGSGGANASGGTNGAGGSDGSANGSGGSIATDGATMCDARTNFTLAIHVVLDVSWPDSIGGNAGTGKLHIWNLAQMMVDGMTLTNTTRPCGSTLPELVLKPLVGGGKLNLEVPNSVWDAPAAPKASTTGTISGWNVGSQLHTETINVLVGLTMPDPNGPWPGSHNMVTAVDSDGDGQPGITAIPKGGAGYVQPPVETPILGFGAKADKVYLASRTALSLSGTVTSCTEQAGMVTVKFFDNHVVGCHVNAGAECTPAQVDFIDMNSTQYNVAGGTFTSKVVPDTASCADARAALGTN
jgi:hypothetical protein